MSAQIRSYYPQESVPDDQVLIEFDNAREANLFKQWWKDEGKESYNQFKSQDEYDPWDQDW